MLEEALKNTVEKGSQALVIVVSVFPGGSAGEEPAYNAGDLGSTPGWEDPLEKGKSTHSSILAWRIPWTEESAELQSKGLQRVGHDRATEHKQHIAPSSVATPVFFK